VADAHARRHGGEVAEGGLAPLQEGVALAVALELQQRVGVIGVGAELVHLHGVVDDQLGRLQRIDLFRIAAQGLHGVAHGGEIDDGGHAGEVLHEDAGGHVGDLAAGLGLRVPVGEEAMSPAVTLTPSSRRSRFSSRILRLKGRRLGSKRGQAVIGVFAAAGCEFSPALEGVH
jgi:hypothetical protein